VDRVDIPFSQMPQVLRDAVVAAEDHDFYEHGGLSVTSVIRAAWTNNIRGRVVQGGSTITQQYVKNAYVGTHRSILRKMKEAIVAIKLERSFSKEEILERYLNTVYFGRGAYGVEAAARTFFGIGARQLRLPQAAYLAGAIRSPETYAHDLDLGKKRRDHVLDAMASLGMIARADADRAAATALRLRARQGGAFSAVIGPNFVEDVRKLLVERYGSDAVYRGGLRVTTTLDFGMQKAAEDAIKGVLTLASDPEAALVAIDPKTGAVRAMVGSRVGFASRQINLASQGHRQPGSAFKPFVLAAALQDGASVRSTFRAPAQITLETGFEPWTVRNYDHRDYGTLDLVQATEDSVNTVYAQLIVKIGASKVVQAAHLAGIESRLSAIPSLALGTETVTPLEMATAYSTFATGGMYAPSFLVSKIVNANGKTLFEHEEKPKRALDMKTANTVAYAMQKVIQEGTGRRASIGRPAAGKTGTTEEHADAWFGGFTPDMTAVVWMGYPESRKPMNDVHGIQVVGGSLPAQIWRDFMKKALDGLPAHPFGSPFFGGEKIGTASPCPAGASPSASPSPCPSGSPTPAPSTTIIVPPTPSTTPKVSKSPQPAPPPKSSPSPSPSPAPT
jgi:penicillin-binding protein 1A